MKDLLKEMLATGAMDSYGGEELTLPAILGAIHLLRKGAFAPTLRLLGTVSRWGVDELGLIRRFVPRDRLLNAAAEEHHGAFGEPFGGNRFLWGALVGDHAGQIEDFYMNADEFITRVVGVRHEGRCERLDHMSNGDIVSLIWDRNNPYDPNAILVMNTHGDDLGYVRRGIARHLARRVKKGAVLSGQVAVLLGDDFGPNERLYIAAKVVQAR